MAQPFNPASATFFDLSPRVKLRVTGGDAFRYLNGQISNDLRKATAESAIQASVLTAKGKLNAVIFVSDDVGSFVLDSDPEVNEELPARLERYVVADDVQIEDVTNRFGIFHVIGEVALPAFSVPVRSVLANRFGQPGRDIWCERGDCDRIFGELSRIAQFCDEEHTERIRIERGIPRWGRELTIDIIPPEANLETTAIDYAKGCYIGQEVISRMKTSGQTNKHLFGLISLSGSSLHPGMHLTTDGGEQREAGWITSAAHSQQLDQEIALGYVKRGFGEAGSRLRTFVPEDPAVAAVPVEVVALPFIHESTNGES
jgi:folate-binding protein YgfZ